ncbi:MAG: hypothetical protein IPP49_09935 [Saprospiraceae bacterium]|nr:hypothetical protein [Saprospiraceae bacterium]
MPRPSCFTGTGSQLAGDVWYSYVVPASGAITIAYTGNVSFTTPITSVYFGSCPTSTTADSRCVTGNTNVLPIGTGAGCAVAGSTIYFRVTEGGVTHVGNTGTATITLTNTATPVLTCPALTAPAVNATNQSVTPTFTWGVATGATGYNVYISNSGTGGCPGTPGTYSLAGTSATTSLVYAGPALANNTSYSWYVVPVLCGIEQTALNCQTAARCFTTLPLPPPNDLCTAATPISCTSGTVMGTTVAATGETIADCGPTSNTSPSVWYSFVGDGQNITLSTCSTNPAVTFDSKLAVYTGSCGSFTCVTGNDDTDVAACTQPNAFESQVSFPSVAGTT